MLSAFPNPRKRALLDPLRRQYPMGYVSALPFPPLPKSAIIKISEERSAFFSLATCARLSAAKALGGACTVVGLVYFCLPACKGSLS